MHTAADKYILRNKEAFYGKYQISVETYSTISTNYWIPQKIQNFSSLFKSTDWKEKTLDLVQPYPVPDIL